MPHANQEMSISPAVALPQDSSISPAVALPQETSISPAVALSQETSISPAVALQTEMSIAPAVAHAIARDVVTKGNGEEAIYAKIPPSSFSPLEGGGAKPKSIHVPLNNFTRFNIMVVGESGLGKTTFLKSMFKDYSDNELIQHDGEKTTGIRKVGQVELTQSQDETVLVTFIDSAGYGDEIDNKKHFDPIINHITKQFRAHKKDKDAELYDDDVLRQRDERVHCCFYFMAPHRFKEIDRKFMEMLQNYVPIVPIAAKADTMTTQEKERHTSLIENAIRESELHIFEFRSTPEKVCNCHSCSGKTPDLRQVDKRDLKVFSIIADANREKRVYPWGEAYVKCKHHSDFAELQELLFDCGEFALLVKETNKRYQAYINQQRKKAADPDAKADSKAEAEAERQSRINCEPIAEKKQRIRRNFSVPFSFLLFCKYRNISNR